MEVRKLELWRTKREAPRESLVAVEEESDLPLILTAPLIGAYLNYEDSPYQKPKRNIYTSLTQT
jgi:DNA-binding XRE family transcriptional regulator